MAAGKGRAVIAEVDMVGASIAGVTGVRPADARGFFVWRCHCGAEFVRRGAAVRLAAKRNGATSCGCALRSARGENGKANRTHGRASGQDRRLYDVWRQMRRRCSDPGCADYPAYGARGVRVAEAWSDVSAFCEWSRASGYRPGLSIDRMDVNGDYEPGNCRWATTEEQLSNLRKSRRLTVDGETLTVSQWSRRTGLHIQTILRRMRAGWDDARALSRVENA